MSPPSTSHIVHNLGYIPIAGAIGATSGGPSYGLVFRTGYILNANTVNLNVSTATASRGVVLSQPFAQLTDSAISGGNITVPAGTAQSLTVPHGHIKQPDAVVITEIAPQLPGLNLSDNTQGVDISFPDSQHITFAPISTTVLRNFSWLAIWNGIIDKFWFGGFATGNGTNQQLAHGLGVIPSCAIILPVPTAGLIPSWTIPSDADITNIYFKVNGSFYWMVFA